MSYRLDALHPERLEVAVHVERLLLAADARLAVWAARRRLNHRGGGLLEPGDTTRGSGETFQRCACAHTHGKMFGARVAVWRWAPCVESSSPPGGGGME